ncbi:MAG: winged helix-turn-helix domain-containing protein [Candidatus Acidiferrales bacterium]
MPSGIWRFEDFELDQGAFELRRAGKSVRLERIPFEFLCLLVERSGQLVTRQEILERIWGKDVFLDADNAINTAVRKIRQALRDNPETPRFLHTVPGKGYRFEAAMISQPSPATDIKELPEAPAPKVADWGGRRWLGSLALVATVVVVSLLARHSFERHTSPHLGKIMLAVLPLENLSGDPREEYFADGMTEEMITQLGRLDPQRLGVIARTSAMQYKGTREGTPQIAQELGVQYLMEGSVRRSGQRVRVTVQLIQASDQTHIWAEDYDRKLSDVLELQSDVARAVASKIQVELSQQTEARLAAAPRVNPEAHEAYLEGLQAWNLRTPEAIERSIAKFNQAVAIDSSYALAYAGLADAYNLAPVFRVSKPIDAFPKAEASASRALALDDELGQAHTALGFSKAHFDYDWLAAEREYQRGIELDPNSTDAHLFYSNSYLSPLGRHDEAISEMKRAIEIDPLSPPIQSFLGRTYIWARRYNEARAQLLYCIEINPNFALNHERLSHLDAQLGDFEDAVTEDAKAREFSGEEPAKVAAEERALRQTLMSGGARAYWLKLLERADDKENPPEAYANAFGRAVIHAELGEKSQALDWLEKAYAERDLAMTELAITAEFDGLRQEPRFQSLLRSIGLAK